MALTQNNPITSADITALKNRVKAEMARRNISPGNLNGYSGDFS